MMLAPLVEQGTGETYYTCDSEYQTVNLPDNISLIKDLINHDTVILTSPKTS